MGSRIPFHRPALSELERTYVEQALEGRWWAGGPFVERLEAALGTYWGLSAVAVSSGTAALEIALKILLGEEGGEVIVPVWTFTSTAAAVYHAGGTPVFADVGETLHLTAETIEAVLTPRTQGVIVVHYAGMAADMSEILGVCERRDLWLIEDACHAQPAYYRGRLCGTFGAVATLSFHATKPVAAGQGGALLFQDGALARKARQWRRHGIVRDNQNYWDYEVRFLGHNYQMPELCAALALAQVELMEERWRRRQAIAAAYHEELAERDEVVLYPATLEECSWHLYPVFVERGKEIRDEVLWRMGQRGYPLNLHYRPLHRHRAYQRWAEGKHFPVADGIYERIMTLPVWPEMSDREVRELAGVLLEVIGEVRLR